MRYTVCLNTEYRFSFYKNIFSLNTPLSGTYSLGHGHKQNRNICLKWGNFPIGRDYIIQLNPNLETKFFH